MEKVWCACVFCVLVGITSGCCLITSNAKAAQSHVTIFYALQALSAETARFEKFQNIWIIGLYPLTQIVRLRFLQVELFSRF